MNPESFEKMDREWMDSLERMRERKVPEDIRRGFRKSVEQRILKAGQGFSFSPAPVLTAVAIVCLGAALCWFYLRPRQPLVVTRPEQRIQYPNASDAVTSFNQEEASAGLPAPVPASVVRDTAPRAALPLPSGPVLDESNIVEEIEALKELGVWTDDDEEEIGVSAEQIFNELEMAAADAPAQSSGSMTAPDSAAMRT